MSRQNRRNFQPLKALEKERTGISGFDEITRGGLPKGRPTLVCGSAGAGKTLFAMEFLVRGVTLFNEPGVFISFEESDVELATNVASLGFDLNELIAGKKLILDYVFIERSEIEETGEYDLEALFLRLGTRLTRSARSESYSTRSKPSSPPYRMKRSSGPSCVVSSAG